MSTSDKCQAKQPRAWQRMLSGRRLDLLDPSPLDVEIEDIALGLSRVARWNGQTTGDWPFSVADHSLYVEHIFGLLRPKASSAERLVALLHDSPEYVIGDLISPFKAVIGGAYKSLENRMLAAIHRRFGLPTEPTRVTMRSIKRADKISAYREAVSLAGFTEEQAGQIFGRPKNPAIGAVVPTARSPEAARAAFLQRFHILIDAK